MTTLRNLYRILSPRERKQVLLLLPLMTVTALLEVAGVASVIPFLTLVANPAAIQEHEILTRLYELGGFESSRQFLIAVGVAMFCLVVGSNGLTALTTWAILRFSWMRNHTISLRLLRGYLAKPYLFFLERHSADLGKNLLTEVQQAVSGTLVPTMQLMARGVAALGVLALLFYVDPVLALLTFVVLGGAYALLYLFIRRRQRRLGKHRFRSNQDRFEVVSEAFGGIKEVKLLGREANAIRRFQDPSFHFAAATAKNQVIGRVPRYLLEALAFGGMVLMVLYLMGTGQEFHSIVPILGLYAFGAYRLMPSLQRIFSSLTSIRFNAPALEKLLEDLPTLSRETVRPEAGPPLRLEEAIRFHDVTFRFPTARRALFRNLDLELPAGKALAFVGETGSGKSTLADLILGLLEPDQGVITVDGRPLEGKTLLRWQKNLGYVPQAIFLANDTVARNIAFGLTDEEIDREAVAKAARAASIDEFIEHELPEGYETVVGERGIRLSGGQRQRIGIARALYHEPEVIVFDEATSSLDTVTEEMVLRAVDELARERTVITIAHRLSTVRKCDKIFLLSDGQILDTGRYDELLETSSEFRSLALSSTGT